MDDKKNELKILYDKLSEHGKNSEDCTDTLQKIINYTIGRIME